MNVEGASVLVTGASSGIGAALATQLAGRGATVGLVGRRADRLADVLSVCQEHAPGSRMWVGDLGELEWAESVALEAWDTFGGLDVLVNNAAIPKVRAVTSLSNEDVELTMRINFLSPVRMTLAVLPRMLARGGGAIVNVASVGGRVGISHEAAYSASKFALTGWSESLWIDLYDTPIVVRLIQPGPIDTDIWDRPGEEHAVYDGPKEPPEGVAEGIIAALGSDRFEHYIPDLKWVTDAKQADVDAFLEGSAKMGSEK
ncbi:MAG TPA: SDR family NAD(P)-dependent oxidoreductase [Acidimicrobiales bacterium]|nr:SDR family NAD(P)-dependent oxidoreductase [Acidimicrobiales bacterium]